MDASTTAADEDPELLPRLKERQRKRETETETQDPRPIICYKLLSKLLTAQTDTKEMTTTTVIGISMIIESFLTAQDRAPTLVPAASSDTALGQVQEVCSEALAKVLQDKEDSKQIPEHVLKGDWTSAGNQRDRSRSQARGRQGGRVWWPQGSDFSVAMACNNNASDSSSLPESSAARPAS